MELIPILSTIILVATISTFILAVGAYILYKIREGKERVSPERKPEYLEAEYFMPKEKKEHKIFVEEVLEPKPKTSKNVEQTESIKSFAENQAQSKFRVVEDLAGGLNVKSSHEQEVVMPKMKFEKFVFSADNQHQQSSVQEEIKWR
jgi:transposase